MGLTASTPAPPPRHPFDMQPLQTFETLDPAVRDTPSAAAAWLLAIDPPLDPSAVGHLLGGIGREPLVDAYLAALFPPGALAALTLEEAIDALACRAAFSRVNLGRRHVLAYLLAARWRRDGPADLAAMTTDYDAGMAFLQRLERVARPHWFISDEHENYTILDHWAKGRSVADILAAHAAILSPELISMQLRDDASRATFARRVVAAFNPDVCGGLAIDVAHAAYPNDVCEAIKAAAAAATPPH